MSSIGLMFGLQVRLFLRPNTAVRSKSISNSYNTEYLVRFKSKYETLLKNTIFLSMSIIFLESY